MKGGLRAGGETSPWGDAQAHLAPKAHKYLAVLVGRTARAPEPSSLRGFLFSGFLVEICLTEVSPSSQIEELNPEGFA